jgi:hypothetical protein
MEFTTHHTVSKDSVENIIATFETTGHILYRTLHEDRVSYILANETGGILIEDYNEGDTADICRFGK